MTNALVLMKAMPPTKGHERLIRFATSFSPTGTVFMDVAPGEPFVGQRAKWLHDELRSHLGWTWVQKFMDDQDPESPGFWERWKAYIDDLGQFDLVIGSEPYCAKVAALIGAEYIPYDPSRELSNAKATEIRKSPLSLFRHVASNFQHYLQTTVTVWGAESTGKTTLSKRLASCIDGEWVFEWARPYLEATNRTVCDLNDMHNIWHGQYAVEESAMKIPDKPFIIRDTDLYSTIGYWEQPHWIDKYGPVPEKLVIDALDHKADLYIITPSNIPFEQDPLRYGGDHRESPDEYWISVAEKYDLNYVVLTERTREARLEAARSYAIDKFFQKSQKLTAAARV